MALFSQDSVYVLDKAQLAAQGVDYWENKRQHSRVNTIWWNEQIKQRKALKKSKGKSPPQVGQGSQHFNSALAYNMVTQKQPNSQKLSYVDKMKVASTSTSTVLSDEDEIESSVIRHPSVSSVVAIEPDLDYEESVDEFQSLLEDYRSASRQLLNSEIEKREQLSQLNQQQTVIDEQNAKIELSLIHI